MTFTFKVSIEETSKPLVWRRIKVPAEITFEKLHFIIQTVFDWQNMHLYSFSPGSYGTYPRMDQQMEDDDYIFEKKYSDAETFPQEQNYRSNEIFLKDFFKTEKQKMKYLYDFGDDWFHKIELEEISDDKLIFPICTKGKGKTPPEDCGGIWGYYTMLEILNSEKKGKDYREYKQWLQRIGYDFPWDENEFNLEETNKILMEYWNEDFEGFKWE